MSRSTPTTLNGHFAVHALRTLGLDATVTGMLIALLLMFGTVAPAASGDPSIGMIGPEQAQAAVAPSDLNKARAAQLSEPRIEVNSGPQRYEGPTNSLLCPVTSAFNANPVYAQTCHTFSTAKPGPTSQMGIVVSGTAGPSSQPGSEAVGIFSAVTAVAGAGDAWGLASTVNIKAGANEGGIAIESDLINENCDPGPAWDRNPQCSTGRYASILLDGIGTAKGIYPNNAALWVLTSNGGVLWHTGLLLSGNSVGEAAIADLTNSETVVLVQGTHNHIVDASAAKLRGSAWAGAFTADSIKSGTFIRPALAAVSALNRLNPSPQVGDMISVSDAKSCVANTPVQGGGRTPCPLIYSGTEWKAIVSN